MGPRPYRLVPPARLMTAGRRQPWRPITVTSGGSTTGSSPGSTPVRAPRYSVTGPGPDPGGRLGPGVDDLEPGVAHQRGEQRADVGMAGVGHRQGARRRSDRPR